MFGRLMVIVLACWLAACTQGRQPFATDPVPSPTSIPEPPVDFEVKDLTGDPVQLSTYRGKVVLVTFWASWCTPCKEELPVLDQYYRDHQEDDFVLIGINAGDDVETAARYIQENGYGFITWSDPPGNRLIELGARGLPFSLLLDREGRRVAAWYGGATPETLADLVTPLLEQPGDPG